MKVKKVKCPMCHGKGSWITPITHKCIGGGETTHCGFCIDGLVSQKKRMIYVRSFKEYVNSKKN